MLVLSTLFNSKLFYCWSSDPICFKNQEILVDIKANFQVVILKFEAGCFLPALQPWIFS